MKKMVLMMAGLLVSGSLVLAQSGGQGPGGSGGPGSGGTDPGTQDPGTQDPKGPGPGGPGDQGGYQYSWSNSVAQSNSYGAVWGKKAGETTPAPKKWSDSNKFSHQYAGQSQAGGGGQVQNRFGKTEVPADVQEIVRQFQQDRTRLMSQLKTCSDEQRKEILKDMEQLRTQLRQQVAQMRDQAHAQAEQMRNRFGNNRDRVLDQGAGTAGSGRDR